MIVKFSEVLEEYLIERDRQNSNYYDDRYVGDKTRSYYYMLDLAAQLDYMVHGDIK